jgi:hypothetical protein
MFHIFVLLLLFKLVMVILLLRLVCHLVLGGHLSLQRVILILKGNLGSFKIGDV